MKTSVLEKIIAVTALLLFFLIIYRYLISSPIAKDIYAQFEQKIIKKEVEQYKNLKENLLEESYRLVKEEGLWKVYTDSGEEVSNFSIQNISGKLSLLRKVENNLPYDIRIDGVGSYFSRGKEIVTDIPFDSSAEYLLVPEQEDMFPIFGYHNIFEKEEEIKDPFVDMRKRDLEAQIKFFNDEMNCRWITLSDAINGFILQERKIPKNTCVITFDDGRKNNFTVALPILKKYGVKGTFFIIGGRIGQPSYMNAQELKELYLNGNDIQSHAYTGGSLVHTEWAGKDFDDYDLQYQINGVKVVLEKYGYNVSLFAYPLGDWNERIVNLIKQFGYSSARGTQKENPWRDKRALATSMDREFSWHFNYYEPQLYEDATIKNDTSYTGRWQFEEGLSFEGQSYDGLLSSTIKPTEKSYGVVTLKGSSSLIKNAFLVENPGYYQVEIFGHLPSDKAIKLSLDGKESSIEKMDQSCITFEQKDFCKIISKSNLSSGRHILEIQNLEKNSDLYLDFFEIKRIVERKNEYNIHIVTQVKE